MKKNLIICFVFLLLVNSNVFSTHLPISSLAQIMRPNDSQGIALGLTGVSYNEGLFSPYSNPAGLSFLNRINFAFSHIPSINMGKKNIMNQENMGFGLPLIKGFAASFHYLFLNFGEIVAYDVHGKVIEKKDSGLRQIMLSGSKLFVKNKNYFSIGINLKYLEEDMAGLDGDVFLLDVGTRYKKELKNKNWYAFGISLCNIGNELKKESFTFEKPIKLMRVGLSYMISKLSNTDLAILNIVEYQKSMNAEKNRNQWTHLGIGVECQYLQYLFGRIGYNFDFDDVDEYNKVEGFTYGFGVTTPEKIKMKLPFYLSLSYGKGLQDHRRLDANVITISIGMDL